MNDNKRKFDEIDNTKVYKRKRYKCDICDKLVYNVKRHKMYVHNINVTWKKCDLCNSQFKTNSNLKHHKMQAHNIDVTWIKCDLCDSQFKTNDKLKSHKMQAHNINVTWKKCDLCDSQFKSNGNLKHHKMQAHNIDVSWKKCDLCDSQFKSNGDLKRHKMYVHNINVTWKKCDLCNSQFKTNSNLKLHKMQAHNIDVTWIKCDLCDSQFKRGDHLKTHVQQVHDIGDFKCQNCFEPHYKHEPYTKNNHTMYLCKECYRKFSGFNSRIELEYVEYIRENFKFPFLAHNKSMNALGGCTRKRPDLIFTSDNLIMIIEIDEHQHIYENGSYSCEEKRITELYENQTIPMVVIRINPHKTTFSTKRCNQHSGKKTRQTRLVAFMNEIVSKQNDDMIKLYYMYYNHDNPKICQNILFEHV